MSNNRRDAGKPESVRGDLESPGFSRREDVKESKLLRKRYGPQSQTTDIPFSCGHIMLYPRPFPRAYDTAWCQRCGDYRMVVRGLRAS
jgi:hypothetical protein